MRCGARSSWPAVPARRSPLAPSSAIASLPWPFCWRLCRRCCPPRRWLLAPGWLSRRSHAPRLVASRGCCSFSRHSEQLARLHWLGKYPALVGADLGRMLDKGRSASIVLMLSLGIHLLGVLRVGDSAKPASDARAFHGSSVCMSLDNKQMPMIKAATGLLVMRLNQTHPPEHARNRINPGARRHPC